MKFIIQKVLMYMNKYDLFLISIIVFISILLLVLFKSNDNNYAYVYYNNDLVRIIDLSIDDSYTVLGYNGEVLILVKDNKLKVVKEESPLHICSKQDFTNEGLIVCLPNKIVIEFGNSNLDTIVG